MIRIMREKITRDLQVLRLLDTETRFFEGLWSIPEGVSYNSYVLDTGEGLVVFDTWKNKYANEYLETLCEVCDPRDISYIVVHHTEPDHSGALPVVLRENSSIKVVGHTITKGLINAFYKVSPEFIEVSDGYELVLGKYHLRFYTTPWLHWPDTIVSYLLEEKILFTCDIFGGYGVFDKLFVEDLDSDEYVEYLWYMKKYLANIVGHYIEWVPKALDKISGLEVKVIAPAHGLLWRTPGKAIELYKLWSSGRGDRRKYVIIYTSMYGFVEKALEKIIDILASSADEIRVFRFTDRVHDSISDLLGEALDATGLVIATSTYEADIQPLGKYLVELIARKIRTPKLVLVIAAYGWGGVAGKKIKEILEKADHKIVDVIEFRSSLIDEKRLTKALEEFLKYIVKS